MAFTKKKWVNVPDPNNYEGETPLSALPRFDADNMNRIEEGIDSKAPKGHGLGDSSEKIQDTTLEEIMKQGCGFYQVQNAEDTPADEASWINLIQSTRGTTNGVSTGMQIASYDWYKNKPQMWFRTMSQGKKSDWVEMIHTGNKSLIKPSDIGAATSGHGLGDVAPYYSGSFMDMIKKGSGFYTVGNATDSPSGTESWLSLLQLTKEYASDEGGEEGLQIAADLLPANNQQGEVWYRTIFNGAPQEWKKLLHSGNYGNFANAKIASGKYVGTGTNGSGNKNSLTFSFEPKFIFIQRKTEASNHQFIALVYGSNFYGDDIPDYTHVEWDGNTVLWWTTNKDDKVQYNESGVTYCYVAIG